MEVIAPSIQQIVNKSLSSGEFSNNFKTALVQPLLMKQGMDLTFKNYRPVSNLSYLSKLIERIVYSRIVTEVHKSGNMEPFQSAYHEGHSTETALLKVKTDIINAIENPEVPCLILLDLNSAFDTVNHSLLLNRLKYQFGFIDKVLKWVS